MTNNNGLVIIKKEVKDMNSLQVTCFLKVAECMSFSQAAAELYVSQPAVSRQIRLLEEELGCLLFDRSRKRLLCLTPAGRAYAGRTLGLSDRYVFWHIRMPVCRQGILAGTVLSFARALGEYGATSMIAGYTPGRTATISTTVYQLWRTGQDALALRWVLVNLALSASVLAAVNLLERKEAGRWR